MRLKSVHLVNVCQHVDRTFNFTPGINGIVGPNGSGKSNMSRAVQYALTGDWPGVGQREHYIRWGDGINDVGESYVDLLFEHNGVDGRIYRTMRGAPDGEVRFTYGDRKLTSSSSASKAVQELLACTPQFLDSFVFVKQGAVDAVVNATPANFSKFFQYLFGMEFYEQVYKVVREEYSKRNALLVPVDDSDLKKDLEDNRGRLAQLEAESQELEQSMEALFSKEHYEAACKDQYAFNSGKQRYSDALVFVKNVQLEIEKIKDSYSTNQSEYRKRQEVMRELLEQGTSASRKLEDLRKSYDLWRRYQTAYLSLSKANEAITLAEKSISGLQPPAPCEVTDEFVKGIESEVQKRSAELAITRSHISNMRDGKCCPLCGTSEIVDQNGGRKGFADLVRDLKIAEHDQAEAINKLRFQHTGAASIVREYRTRVDRFQLASQQARSNLDQAVRGRERFMAEIDELGTVPTSDPSADLKATSDESAKINANLAKVSSEMKELERLITVSETMLKEKPEALSRESKYISEYEELEKRVTPIAPSIDLYANKKTRHSEIKYAISSLTAVNNKIQEQLEKAAIARQRYVKDKHFVDLLGRTGEVFHRDALPSIVSHKYYQMIQRAWNQVLVALGVPFVMEITESNGVEVRHQKGNCNISDLSGGERCCAAISLYLTVHQFFSRMAGFLFMDEPTYGPDDARIQSLAEFLTRVGQYCNSAEGTQIFISTHDPRLLPSFNNVIDVSTPSS